jgi:hypothetical protein
MPLPIQVPDGTVVLSNRFGDGPFEDCQQFTQVRLPQGIEIEGIYNAAHGAQPQRFWLYAIALWHGQRSYTIGQRWAPRRHGDAGESGSNHRSVNGSRPSQSANRSRVTHRR